MYICIHICVYIYIYIYTCIYIYIYVCTEGPRVAYEVRRQSSARRYLAHQCRRALRKIRAAATDSLRASSVLKSERYRED